MNTKNPLPYCIHYGSPANNFLETLRNICLFFYRQHPSKFTHRSVFLPWKKSRSNHVLLYSSHSTNYLITPLLLPLKVQQLTGQFGVCMYVCMPVCTYLKIKISRISNGLEGIFLAN